MEKHGPTWRWICICICSSVDRAPVSGAGLSRVRFPPDALHKQTGVLSFTRKARRRHKKPTSQSLDFWCNFWGSVHLRPAFFDIIVFIAVIGRKFTIAPVLIGIRNRRPFTFVNRRPILRLIITARFHMLMSKLFSYYTIPCAFIASATLRKPAMLAPAT